MPADGAHVVVRAGGTEGNVGGARGLAGNRVGAIACIVGGFRHFRHIMLVLHEIEHYKKNIKIIQLFVASI